MKNLKISIVVTGAMQGVLLSLLLSIVLNGQDEGALNFSRFLQQSGGIKPSLDEGQGLQQQEPSVEEPPLNDMLVPEPISDEPLDTVDVEEGGNWLLKRQALETAMDHIEQVNNLYEKIVQARFEFASARSKASNERELFVARLGYSLKDLDAAIADFLNLLESPPKNEDEQEQKFFEGLKAHKAQLQEIKDAAAKLPIIDAKLDEAVASIEPQVARARGYKAEAWRHFQAIKRVWSEERAEDLLRQTEALLAIMQKLYNNWLRQELAQYVQELMRNASSQISVIANATATLSKDGIDIVQKIKELRGDQPQESKQEQVPDQKNQEDPVEKKIQASSKEQSIGFFGLVESYFNSLITTIFKPFTWFKRFWS